jgi:hypothetical protein
MRNALPMTEGLSADFCRMRVDGAGSRCAAFGGCRENRRVLDPGFHFAKDPLLFENQ